MDPELLPVSQEEWEAYEKQKDEELRLTLEAYANGERGLPINEAFAAIDERTKKRRASRLKEKFSR